jgi:hypothetical protein
MENTMKKYFFLFLLFFITTFTHTQNINYSSAYFGPNANPVPQFTDATIPVKTTFQLSANYFFGYGDQTSNVNLITEIPLITNRVSFKVWCPIIEHHNVTEKVYQQRNMQNGKLHGKTILGDAYLQTRMLVCVEKKYLPNIILNTTLKTASSTTIDDRRYFDTPGYYFNVEIGKSLHLQNKIINEIRGVINSGFLCWETTNSRQNDAPLYGAKIILANQILTIENTLSGYRGWMNNGDAPLIYIAQICFKRFVVNYFAEYQYGIRDFPYHHLQVGVTVPLSLLTPKYD